MRLTVLLQGAVFGTFGIGALARRCDATTLLRSRGQ
jgi:hypothetical protein